MRFLEYDTTTGRILSEVRADAVPEATGSLAYFEIPDALTLDTNSTLVKDGELVRAYETPDEKRAREAALYEARARAQKMVHDLREAFLTAQLEDDATRIAELKKEYKKLKQLL